MCQWDRKLKKVQAKKLVKSYKSKKIFRQIAFLAVLKHFPSSKYYFWLYLKLQKMELGQKQFREIDLVFDFTSFFGLDFFKFSDPCIVCFLSQQCKKFTF